MSAGSDDVHKTTGPDVQLARRLSNIVDDLPTITRKDVEDEYQQKYPNTSIFADEGNTGGLERQYRPAEHDLPGFGEQYDWTDAQIPCGTPLVHVCKDHGHTFDVGRTCSRSVCPRCAPAWVTKRARNIVQNIWAAAKMKEGSQKKHHVVFSPPPDLLLEHDEPWDAMGEMIQDFMREIDMDGIALAHPYSGKSDGDFTDSHNDDRGEWKKRLFADRSWSDVRSELQFRPHFHVIGVCEWFPGGDVTKQIYNETGWVIHRITRNGSSVSLGGIENVARGVSYALSHCAIDTTGETNRYLNWKVGFAYHNNDGRHEQAARDAVNKVVPDTLGIAKMDVSCREAVPEEECDHDHHEPGEELEESDGSTESSSNESSMVPCQGEICCIDNADFVESEAWQQSVKDPEQAVQAREEWIEQGGWQGFMEEQTGQATLPDRDPPE